MNNRNHHAIDDLKEVHDYMVIKNNLKVEAAKDAKQAEQIEKYLRAIKSIRLEKEALKNNEINSTLEDLALEDLEEIVQGSMNILNQHGRSFTAGLFRHAHSYKKSKKVDLEADDIAEEEVYAVLKFIESKMQTENINAGIEITGGKTANVVNSKILTELADDLARETTNGLATQVDYSKYIGSDLIKLRAVSQKVDVTGISSSVDIEAELDEKWQNIAKAFQGANFTIKNYSSYSKGTTIHLGNSNPFRAIYGAISYLGFSHRESSHIYYHSFYSYKNKATADKQSHIYHLRLMYELMGVGLYDAEGNPISAANFLIYNDPGSENIYVRSTKQIILDFITSHNGFSGDPFKSDIVIKKSYF